MSDWFFFHLNFKKHKTSDKEGFEIKQASKTKGRKRNMVGVKVKFKIKIFEQDEDVM